MNGASSSVLDERAFSLRLGEHVSLVQRNGGFLSLAVVRGPRGPDVEEVPPRLRGLSERLRERVRAHDVVGWRGTTVAILMPGTDVSQAQSAVRRILAFAADEPLETRRAAEAAGIAAVYGAMEGGPLALLQAAEAAAAQAAPGEIAVSRSLHGRPRILVVDDDAAFAEALADAISERGWEGHPCSDSRDARQRVGLDEYSGMFVDVVMPPPTGLDILNAALAHAPRRPAVLMSGHDVPPDALLDALSLGPVTFIRKPIAGKDLDLALAMFRGLLPGTTRR